ncbi:hypothetical protein COLO4_27925 [Corchorus olitorius]|uniref:Nodulin-related protein 1 n=1 Tax=Corchorus olitorius TaxID=93759 RepID=A0A1R3HNI8_9ROSI|nr:hypothetical protein COLO4_27925 [Corchorus olitorius]
MESAKSDHHNKPTSNHHPKSSSELLSSAKLVAEYAKSTMNHESGNNIDKGKVAGAAADLLDAASHYGKLDQGSGVGKYVDQAENYLHKYHSSHSTTATTTTHSSGGGGGHSTTPEKHSEAAHASGGGHGHDSGSGGGGHGGDYLKMAQDFLKKH